MRACAHGGVDPADVADELDRTVEGAADLALAHLAELLATDVDLQRTTPLSVFRVATSPVAAFLRERGVHPPPATPMSSAGDEFQLEPTTWSDIDGALHEPGLRWGAWKAMTVLARRRDEGLR